MWTEAKNAYCQKTALPPVACDGKCQFFKKCDAMKAGEVAGASEADLNICGIPLLAFCARYGKHAVCKTAISPVDECALVRCKAGTVCKAGACENDPKYNCCSYFDGCNTCNRATAASRFACTRMLCIGVPQQPVCKKACMAEPVCDETCQFKKKCTTLAAGNSAATADVNTDADEALKARCKEFMAVPACDENCQIEKKCAHYFKSKKIDASEDFVEVCYTAGIKICGKACGVSKCKAYPSSGKPITAGIAEICATIGVALKVAVAGECAADDAKCQTVRKCKTYAAKPAPADVVEMCAKVGVVLKDAVMIGSACKQGDKLCDLMARCKAGVASQFAGFGSFGLEACKVLLKPVLCRSGDEKCAALARCEKHAQVQYASFTTNDEKDVCRNMLKGVFVTNCKSGAIETPPYGQGWAGDATACKKYLESTGFVSETDGTDVKPVTPSVEQAKPSVELAKLATVREMTACSGNSGKGKYKQCSAAGCAFDVATKQCSAKDATPATATGTIPCSGYSGKGKYKKCTAAGCAFELATKQCSAKDAAPTTATGKCAAHSGAGKYKACTNAGCFYEKIDKMCGCNDQPSKAGWCKQKLSAADAKTRLCAKSYVKKRCPATCAVCSMD